MNKEYFDEINKTNNSQVIYDFIYYNKIKHMFPNIDFKPYVIVNDNNEEIISIHDYHLCLLENDVDYKNYVIDEVLYDIDKYGYYADGNVEHAFDMLDIAFEENILEERFERQKNIA